MAVGTNVAEQDVELVELFHQYKVKAFHFALQTLGNRDDAMDVTQEAFLRLQRHWRRRDASRPFAPWLYSVVRNLAIDVLRKRSTRRECELEGAPEVSPVPSPETNAQRKELSARLWAEIQRLPEAQRETLLLRDWHGLSYSEIAEVTGTNVTTVNSRLHDARERLRERLRRYL
ncbi:MAG: sigma-70 family RNA polymerase sigma factor [Bryobacteraceae bacterium]|nr:sigma-70 family RNA polymerase sigma factor [Bryobacteraceae bacterium]